VNAIPGIAARPPSPASGAPLAARLAAVLPPGSLWRRLATGAGWSILGSGLAQGLALGAATLAARALGAADYGSLVVALATCTLLAEVAGAGIGVAATRHVAEQRLPAPDRAGRLASGAVRLAAAAGALLALLQLLSAPWLAGTVLASPSLAPLLRVAAPLTLAAAVGAAQAGVLSGLEDFRGLAFAAAARGAATLALVIPGALLGGAPGALLGYVGAAAAGALVQARAIRRRAGPGAPRADDVRELLRTGIPAAASSLVLTLATWGSTALLARESLAEAGVLGVARQWQAAVLFLSGAVSGLGLPLVASALPARDPAALRRALGASFAASTGLALLAAVPVALLSPLLLSWSGPAFAGRSLVVVLACGAAVLLAANVAVGQAIWALGAHRAGVLLALLRGALLVGLSAWLASRGAEGIALAGLGSAALLTAVQAPFLGWLLSRTAAAWRNP
jgi:O-antigen/teichoic acid export membrane protein